MPSTSLWHVVHQLRQTSLLVRTAVALVPVDELARGPDIAAQHGIDYVDYLMWKLERIKPEQRFIGLDRDQVLLDLESIANQDAPTGCILLANADIPLARLSPHERDAVWMFLFDSFKRRRNALILVLPRDAFHLFPMTQRGRWQQAGRVADISDNGPGGSDNDDAHW